VMVSPAEGFVPPGVKAPGAVRLALGGEVERGTCLEGVVVVAEMIAAG
jgi:hypothetical protein